MGNDSTFQTMVLSQVDSIVTGLNRERHLLEEWDNSVSCELIHATVGV